jgi:predicted transcriptional regulator
MSNKNSNLLRIGFKNHSLKLLDDTKNGFIKLGFNPSKIINNSHFFISRQNEIIIYKNNNI